MTFYTDILRQAAVRASKEFGHEVTVEELRSRTKARCIVEPRFYAIAYMHAIGRFSFPQIARAFGFKNHTTIIHALRRAHGYDGKGVSTDRFKGREWEKLKPLWKKEHFENLVFIDGFTSQAITSPTYEALMLIGERNLRQAVKSLEQPIELGEAA